MISNLILLTGKHNKHLIVVAHESSPNENNEISILLGGELPQQTTLQLSEVWNFRDQGGERYAIVRSVGMRKPMKSRMFDTTKGFEFLVSSTKAGPSKDLRLDTIFEKWKSNNYNKIPLPT